jgi:hypothetical protein
MPSNAFLNAFSRSGGQDLLDLIRRHRVAIDLRGLLDGHFVREWRDQQAAVAHDLERLERVHELGAQLVGMALGSGEQDRELTARHVQRTGEPALRLVLQLLEDHRSQHRGELGDRLLLLFTEVEAADAVLRVLLERLEDASTDEERHRRFAVLGTFLRRLLRFEFGLLDLGGPSARGNHSVYIRGL